MALSEEVNDFHLLPCFITGIELVRIILICSLKLSDSLISLTSHTVKVGLGGGVLRSYVYFLIFLFFFFKKSFTYSYCSVVLCYAFYSCLSK